MTWLVTHMWMALAATGGLALLLGWSARGVLLVGRLRKATVEREMARVELAQAREEIERLFAAQRAAAPSPVVETGSDQPQLDVSALLRRLEEAKTALAQKGAELDALKASQPAAAETNEKLVWQNRHLESRIQFLESELEKLKAVPASDPASSPAPDPAAAVDAAKRGWQASYLQTRVNALEAQLLELPARTPPAASTEESPVEEELARLRWRNRYLEGRVAYFEAGAAESAAPDARSEPEPEQHISETILGKLEAADARADAAEAPAIIPARPPGLERPPTAGGDDLTQIGGIGPRIQQVLNSLGVYEVMQIAAWTPENVAWVDDYLSFGGRIVREGWVEQAAALVAERSREQADA